MTENLLSRSVFECTIAVLISFLLVLVNIQCQSTDDGYQDENSLKRQSLPEQERVKTQLFKACRMDSLSLQCRRAIFAALQNDLLNEARIHCQAILLQRPYDPDAHFWTGYIFLQKSEFHRAHYHTALSLQYRPNHFAAKLNLARIQSARGYSRKAEYRLRRLIVDYPRSYEPFLVLGQHYYRLGRYKQAELSYARALKLKPGQTEIVCGYGEVLAGLAKTKEALGYLNQCLRSVPERKQAMEFKLQALFRLGRYREGYRFFDSMEDQNRSARMFIPAAMLAFKLGKYTEAESLLHEAESRGMDFEDRGLYLGIIAVRKNDWQTAQRHLRDFLETDNHNHPELGLAHYNLAKTYHALESMSLARMHLEKSCQRGYAAACKLLGK